MKHEIIFKVQMNCGKKQGRVKSLSLRGDDRIVVRGDGIDAARLTYRFRREVGHTDCISIKPMQ
ncbi:disease resistance protein [Salix suchowensis]|nr:disease resistance protein [Salix suchowensis]